jgi:hypothetical protein
MATAAVEGAPFVCHERALDALLKGSALHILSSGGIFGEEDSPQRELKLLVYSDSEKVQEKFENRQNIFYPLPPPVPHIQPASIIIQTERA